MLRNTSLILMIFWGGSVAWGQVGKPDSPEGVAFFEKKIRPVLVAECQGCHAEGKGKKAKGGLAVDTREGLRKGGDSGAVIVPGEPGKSLLIQAMGHGDPQLAMPPKKKLDSGIVKDFEEWVRMGAPDPRGNGKAPVTGVDLEQGRKHWAYQKPTKVKAPAVKDAGWPKTDVDRFVLAALEAKGLQPVADAEKRTLLRRLTFDLTGLPPTVAEVEAFVGDQAPGALERVVDRLLASPGFGEKWGRHWLDVARFAESTGKTVNFNYPHAWRYRDWVIAAFNADKPYDQFIQEQIAGDLMPSDDPKVKMDRMIATGFLAIGPKTLNERSGLKFELDVADEQIDVTTQAFLGITAACARCHDHKFDPITQKDYYALAGIFRSTETCYGTVRFINAQRVSPLLPLPKEASPVVAVASLREDQRERVEEQLRSTRKTMAEMKDQIQRFLMSGRVSLLQARLDAYDAEGNPKLLAMGARDKPAGPDYGPGRNRLPGAGQFTYDGTRAIGDSPVYMRGEADKPTTERVARGTPQVLAREALKIPEGSSGRLELAGWIPSKENPLTARVLVNRVWLHLFGRGLVPTPDDFGFAGRPPTHPELLDHLAHRFMDEGWSVKKLVRHLVLSHVYQQGSRADKKNLEVDPDNTLYWRMSPRRLEAESLRDAMLAVSGELDRAPPVGSAVAQAGEGPVAQRVLGNNQVVMAVNEARDTQRSVYLPVVRDQVPESLGLFDGADPSLITPVRLRTTVPSQGLYLLNNAFVIRRSDAAAEKVAGSGETEEAKITGLYGKFFGRPPSDKELAGARNFLREYRARVGKEEKVLNPEREPWSALCQAFFASAEFQYRQ